MYRVEWLDFDGEIKVMRGFKNTAPSIKKSRY